MSASERNGMVPLNLVYQRAGCTEGHRLTAHYEEQGERVVFSHFHTVNGWTVNSHWYMDARLMEDCVETFLVDAIVDVVRYWHEHGRPHRPLEGSYP